MSKKNNTTLPTLIAGVIAILSIVGLLRATNWLVFWISIGLLAVSVIVMVLLVLRPRRVRRADYEQRVSDSISHRDR